MSLQRFYIAFSILVLCVVITISAFAFILLKPVINNLLAGEKQAINKIDRPIENHLNPRIGKANARLKIIVFGDFLCPVSKKNSVVLIEFYKNYPDDVEIIWKHFPNTELHPTAAIAAAGAQCANEQNKFLEYHNLLFENQSSLASSDVSQLLFGFADQLKLDRVKFVKCLISPETLKIIGMDFEEGKALGITGTPYLFINDVVKIDGEIKYEELEEYIK